MELYKIITDSPTPPSMHEVAIVGLPRKLMWDLDFDVSKFDSIPRGTDDLRGWIKESAESIKAEARRRKIPSDLVTTYASGDVETVNILMQQMNVVCPPWIPKEVEDDLLLLRSPSKNASSWMSNYFGERIMAYDSSFWADADKVNGASVDLLIYGLVATRHFLRFLAKKFPHTYIILAHSCQMDHYCPKYSMHIVCGVYCPTGYDIQELADSLYREFVAQDNFAPLIAEFIDMQVYKTTQNFRITGCKKLGKDDVYVKRIMNNPFGDPFVGWYHTLFTYIDGSTDLCLGPKIGRGVGWKNDKFDVTSNEISARLPSNFIQLLAPHSNGFAVKEVHGNFVRLMRLEQSSCLICGRLHESDNSLMVIVTTRSYILMCRRDISHKKIYIPITSRIKTLNIASTKGIETVFQRVDEK
jgi:hypothetical protein